MNVVECASARVARTDDLMTMFMEFSPSAILDPQLNRQAVKNLWEKFERNLHDTPNSRINKYFEELDLHNVLLTPKGKFVCLHDAMVRDLGMIPDSAKAHHPYNFIRYVIMSQELQRKQDLSLQAAWPQIRMQLLAHIEDHLLPGVAESAENIRNWINNPMNKNSIEELQILDLGSRGLLAVPDEIKRFTGLRTIFLMNNQIQALQPDQFLGLSQLEELYIMKNQIRELVTGAFNGLANLQKLYLYDNVLSNVQKRVFNLVNLQRIYLSSGQVEKFPGGIFNDCPALVIEVVTGWRSPQELTINAFNKIKAVDFDDEKSEK